MVDNPEPDRFVYKNSGKLILVDDDEVDVEIGSFVAFRVDLTSARNEGQDFFNVFDCHSSVLLSYFEDLYDIKAADFKSKVYKLNPVTDWWNPNLLIIDRITIYKEHRGHGYALEAIQGLIKILGMGINVIALKPFPLQFEAKKLDGKEREEFIKLGLDDFEKNEKKATNKLMKLYSEIGFKKVSSTPYMALVLDR